MFNVVSSQSEHTNTLCCISLLLYSNTVPVRHTGSVGANIPNEMSFVSMSKFTLLIKVFPVCVCVEKN